MKKAVHKLVVQWDESLHIIGDAYWRLEGINDPGLFFRHLPTIFPLGMTLLFEGLDLGLTAKSLYGEYPANYIKKVACDTISPVPESHHVAFGMEFSNRLCQLIESQGLTAAFDHFKGYSEQEILFTFHDAFKGELVLSGSLTEASVREFAGGLRCNFERAVFAVDQREQLIRFDQFLNPPWWRRALRFLLQKNDG